MKTCAECGTEIVGDYGTKMCGTECFARRRKKLDRARYLRQRDERLAAKKLYDATPERKAAAVERTTRMRRKYPDKNRARELVHLAVGRKKNGLVRLPCSKCGNPKSEAHHPDYSKPLEVIWLCRAHHVEADRALAVQPNAA